MACTAESTPLTATITIRARIELEKVGAGAPRRFRLRGGRRVGQAAAFTQRWPAQRIYGHSRRWGAPLEVDLEIIGCARLELCGSSDQPDTDFIVRVADEAPRPNTLHPELPTPAVTVSKGRENLDAHDSIGGHGRHRRNLYRWRMVSTDHRSALGGCAFSLYLGANVGTPRRGGAAKSKHPHMSSDLSPGKASKPPKEGRPKLRRQNFTRLMCE